MSIKTYLWIALALFLETTNANPSCSNINPCKTFQGGQPFENPPEIRSDDDEFNATLVVDIGNVTIDWLQMKTRLYNGMYPGPTIRLRPGQRFNLTIVNNLQHQDPHNHTVHPNHMTTLQSPNSTNIHTHGLHISSEGHQDDVLHQIKPNSSFTYNYEINDQHNAGTFWYHPHYHGSVHFQILGLMSGMIIIEDEPDDNITDANEIQMVMQAFGTDYLELQQYDKMKDYFELNSTVNNTNQTLSKWLQQSNVTTNNDTQPPSGFNLFLVNGLLEPQLTIERGRRQRFRMVNCGGSKALAVQISPPNFCEVKVIAYDGIYHSEPQDQFDDRTLLLPGNRADLMVICRHAGNFTITSNFNSMDTSMYGHNLWNDGTLMRVTVVDNGTYDDQMLTALPTLPPFLDDLTNLNDSEINGRFIIELGGGLLMNREWYPSADNYYRYHSNVSTYQEWQLLNTVHDESHPIHIHVNSFQIVSYNNYTGPIANHHGALFTQNGTLCKHQYYGFDNNSNTDPLPEQLYSPPGYGLGYVPVGQWRDVLLVPPLSNITIRFYTDNYTGPVVMHCHRTYHEDLGMMMLTQIVNKGDWMDANITNYKGTYPQACMENKMPDFMARSSGVRATFSYSVGMLMVIASIFISILWE